MTTDHHKTRLRLTEDGRQALLESAEQTWQLTLTGEGRDRTITDWEGTEPETDALYPLIDVLLSRLQLDTLTLAAPVAARWSLTHPAWEHHDDGSARLQRAAFYQMRELWLSHDMQPLIPEIWTQTGEVPHPRRPSLPDGILYRRYHPGLDQVLELRQARVDEDGERFHRWQNLPRVSRFWEYPFSRERLDQMLADRRADPNSFPLILLADGDPVGYFETYYVPEDRLGPYCNAGPFDQGMHVLVGEERYCGKGQAPVWINTLTHYLFLTDPRTRTLYGEPDAANQAMLKQAENLTWRIHEAFDFPHKRARLVSADRHPFFTNARL
ncbi:GNAT family N-acetyltransferase [Tamilnaduibacter salinus]|uniref:GNAT family N-acetyltransferase n=1 Tax=Tamilnaduibacter salinus TaxID=1484056 RepID=A0A2A2I170_9GAMM|nr:GNAT family N-acetyltransferase [Tamilnaduibacter salinus]PAV25352.1 GNAT family N-acetyltransferase [Tamilnaduibacter salinus]